jgi:membrane protein
MRLMLGHRLWEAIRRHRAGRALLLMIDTLDEHHAPIAASAIAFDAFLSLVPLAAFAGLVLTRLHESGDVFVDALFRAAPTPVADLVAGAIGRLSESDAAVVAPLSLVAFIWTTSAGLSTAMSVFESMFHSPLRTWWWRRGIAMVCVLASVATMAAVTSIAVGLRMLSPAAGAVAAYLFPGATLVGMLAAFFRIAVRSGQVASPSAGRTAPVALPRRRRVAPGVLVTILLWMIVSGIFSVYVRTFARYATLYGQLAAVAIFLFYLWLLALALLVGGEVNAQLDGLRDQAPPPPDQAP